MTESQFGNIHNFHSLYVQGIEEKRLIIFLNQGKNIIVSIFDPRMDLITRLTKYDSCLPCLSNNAKLNVPDTGTYRGGNVSSVILAAHILKTCLCPPPPPGACIRADAVSRPATNLKTPPLKKNPAYDPGQIYWIFIDIIGVVWCIFTLPSSFFQNWNLGQF